MEKQLEKHLVAAIKKIPKTKKIGLLFSGGVDSLAIAFYLKKLDYNFTCYTVALKDTNAEDLKYAKELAKELKFKLKTKEVNLKNIPK